MRLSTSPGSLYRSPNFVSKRACPVAASSVLATGEKSGSDRQRSTLLNSHADFCSRQTRTSWALRASARPRQLFFAYRASGLNHIRSYFASLPSSSAPHHVNSRPSRITSSRRQLGSSSISMRQRKTEIFCMGSMLRERALTISSASALSVQCFVASASTPIRWPSAPAKFECSPDPAPSSFRGCVSSCRSSSSTGCRQWASIMAVSLSRTATRTRWSCRRPSAVRRDSPLRC
mmetsp:Transcript_26018/g.65569  ORF Transcript_26018/g.65569 Transcript_26018/m.65569 type:complete len:233 (+) Transcript_26018:7894-8592(+)